MKLIKLAVAVSAASMMAMAADATIYTATFTGTVLSGSDKGNLFGGGNLTGEAFTSVYTYDSSLGNRSSPIPGLFIVDGGSSFGGTPPITSAAVTIAGHTVSITGIADALLYYGETPDASAAGYEALTVGSNLIMDLSNQIQDNNDQPYGTPTLNYSGDVSGASTNKGRFLYQTSGLGATDDLSFKNTTFSIAAVPEASTWAMMLMGFGAIGWSVRRREVVVSIA